MNEKLNEEPSPSQILRNGGIILCPTDTIWGISCNAYDQKAVNRIYEIKGREINKPFILLVDSIPNLKKYIVSIHPRVETLIHYHRRPISVIYQSSPELPKYLSGGDGSVAIRVTKDPFLMRMISVLGKPIVSTSANIANRKSPEKFSDIDTEIIKKVDYVKKASEDGFQRSKSSMLIRYNEEGELFFLRK